MQNIYKKILLLQFIFLVCILSRASFAWELSSGKTMQEISNKLDEIPYKSKASSGSLLTIFKGLNEYKQKIADHNKNKAGIPYDNQTIYLPEFKKILFPLKSGITIVGNLAVIPFKKAPVIIIIHGMLDSKAQKYVYEVANTALSEWGFHVLTLDLREHGETWGKNNIYSTCGWKESEDVIEIANFLHTLPEITKVCLLGFSLGANAAIIAAGKENRDLCFDGGVIAICPPADLKETIDNLDKNVFIFTLFRYILIKSIRGKLKKRIKNQPEISSQINDYSFKIYFEKLIYPAYQKELKNIDELYYRSSSINFIERVKLPLLIMYAADDPIVSSEQSEKLKNKSLNNSWVNIKIFEDGGHIAFMYYDRKWFFEYLKTFFQYWAV